MGNVKQIMSKKDNSPRIHQEPKLKDEIVIRDRPDLTEKQKELINLILSKNTNIVLCKGPSGTSKTFISVYCGLKLLNQKRISKIYFIRNPVESSFYSVGFLKGDINEKFHPYLLPLEDKLKEFLNQNDINLLNKENRIEPVPLGFMRGASLNTSYIIVEESQNLKIQDLLLIMTRLGRFSKLICIGDTKQSDIRNSGFQTVYSLFDDDESKKRGIHTFEFTKQDIVRNEILSFIIEKFENL